MVGFIVRRPTEPRRPKHTTADAGGARSGAAPGGVDPAPQAGAGARVGSWSTVYVDPLGESLLSITRFSNYAKIGYLLSESSNGVSYFRVGNGDYSRGLV